MKPKKFLNLVLTMVGALFLTLLLSHVNGVSAAAPENVYYYQSDVDLSPEELEATTFSSLTMSEVSDGQTIGTLYFNSATGVNLYIKITNVFVYKDVDYDGSDIHPNGWANYIADAKNGDSLIFMPEDTSAKDVLYYQISMEYGDRSVILYDYDVMESTGDYTNQYDGGTDYLIHLKDEMNGNAPDITVDSTITFKKENATLNYFEDELTNYISTIHVYENGSVTPVNSYFKAKMVDGEESFAIGTFINYNLVISKTGSGLKDGKWYTSICSFDDENNAALCNWEERTTANYEGSFGTAGTYYLGMKAVSNLGYSVIRIYKLTLMNQPTVDLSSIIAIKDSGSELSSKLQSNGDLNFGWSNENVTVSMNTKDIYYDNESLKINGLFYSKNGEEEVVMCKYGSLACSFDDSYEIKFTTADQKMNVISLRVRLGDKSEIVYSINVGIDASKPVTPTYESSSNITEFGGSKYYTTEKIIITPSISDNLVEGVESLSGVDEATLTLEWKNVESDEYTLSFEILVENGKKYELSLLAGMMKMTIFVEDKAGNESKMELEFKVDFQEPLFLNTADVIVDETASNFVDHTDGLRYFYDISFYILKDSINSGASGIKKVEYCSYKLEKENDDILTSTCD